MNELAGTGGVRAAYAGAAETIGSGQLVRQWLDQTWWLVPNWEWIDIGPQGHACRSTSKPPSDQQPRPFTLVSTVFNHEAWRIPMVGSFKPATFREHVSLIAKHLSVPWQGRLD